MVSGSSSSEHSLISDSTSSSILDKASASLFSLPGLYFIVKWKSANSATHLEFRSGQNVGERVVIAIHSESWSIV